MRATLLRAACVERFHVQSSWPLCEQPVSASVSGPAIAGAVTHQATQRMIVVAGSTDSHVPIKGGTLPLADIFEFDFSASWFKQARSPRLGRNWFAPVLHLPCWRCQARAAPPH